MSTTWKIISWVFGLLLFAIGIVNTFWGNDPGLGIGLLLLSFLYFPPVSAAIEQKTGFKIPGTAKIVLGLLLIWATLGVGELFSKIDLMMEDLS